VLAQLAIFAAIVLVWAALAGAFPSERPFGWVPEDDLEQERLQLRQCIRDAAALITDDEWVDRASKILFDLK
jgi:hypothetical protein